MSYDKQPTAPVMNRSRSQLATAYAPVRFLHSKADAAHALPCPMTILPKRKFQKQQRTRFKPVLMRLRVAGSNEHTAAAINLRIRGFALITPC